jgi:PAS domain S-box-containing protein
MNDPIERHGSTDDVPVDRLVVRAAESLATDEPLRLARAEDRRALEAERDDAMRLLHAFIEAVPGCVYAKGLDGRVMIANQGVLALLGRPREAVVGHTVEELVREPQDVAAILARDRRIVETGVPEQFEETVVDPTGLRRVWLSSKAPFRDADGRTIGLVGASVDITERKATEAALRESEARFRSLADGLPLIVWVHGPEGELEFVNETYCAFFGVSRERMRGGAWQALVHPDDAQAYAGEFARCVHERRPFHAEARVADAAGEWRWIESWGRPRFSPEGTFLGFVGTSADITERKRVEDALRDADRRKDEFIAMLSHELRNPLAPIRTGLRLLEHETLSERGRAALRMVARQSDGMARLVGELLDVSRVTYGLVALQPERTTFTERRQRLVLEMPAEPLRLDADPLRLAQIVENLLSNASKYTDAGGTITVHAHRDEDEATLEVRDTGIGIPAAKLETVFDRFTQVHGHDARAHGGLGIGLAVVRQLVSLHRGRVTAASDGPGRGATFTVVLPLGEPPHAEVDPTS